MLIVLLDVPESLRAKVLADTKTATGWVYSAIQQITELELYSYGACPFPR